MIEIVIGHIYTNDRSDNHNASRRVVDIYTNKNNRKVVLYLATKDINCDPKYEKAYAMREYYERFQKWAKKDITNT